jgi:COMPASS component SWD2
MQREFQVLDLSMGSVILNDSSVANIEFSRDGNYAVSTTKEGTIYLIDCLTGIEKKKMFTRTHGIGQMKFTYHPSCILISSTQKNNDIRYMCMHDNRYVRLFRHQEDRVSSLAMNPIDDYFLSASSSSVCLWSLGSTNPLAKLNLPANTEQTSVAYDGTGLVFGVSCFDGNTRSRSIKLFDARNFEQGPFEDLSPSFEQITNALSANQSVALAQAQAQRILQSNWSSFEFSPDGFHLLVNTSEALIVLDGFKKGITPIVIPRKNESGTPLGGCLSADAKFVLLGTEENELQIYDKLTGTLKNTLMGHVAPVGCVRCNPKYDLIASGCVNTALWIRGVGSL